MGRMGGILPWRLRPALAGIALMLATAAQSGPVSLHVDWPARLRDPTPSQDA